MKQNIQNEELQEKWKEAKKLKRDKLLKEIFLRTLKQMPAKLTKDNKFAISKNDDDASDENFFNMFNKIKNKNLQDDYGWGFLHYAVVRNNFDVVNALLKTEIDVNLKSIDGETPLFLAVQFERLEMVKKLLQNGADVNVVDSLGNHLLYMAKIKKNEELNKILNLEYWEEQIDIYKNEIIEKQMMYRFRQLEKDKAFQASISKELGM